VRSLLFKGFYPVVFSCRPDVGRLRRVEFFFLCHPFFSPFAGPSPKFFSGSRSRALVLFACEWRTYFPCFLSFFVCVKVPQNFYASRPFFSIRSSPFSFPLSLDTLQFMLLTSRFSSSFSCATFQCRSLAQIRFRSQRDSHKGISRKNFPLTRTSTDP